MFTHFRYSKNVLVYIASVMKFDTLVLGFFLKVQIIYFRWKLLKCLDRPWECFYFEEKNGLCAELHNQKKDAKIENE